MHDFKKLDKNFFKRNTLKVAQELLGKVLCVKKENDFMRGIIIETEAYRGEDDLACHASKGRTKRTEVLYKGAGTVYVYLIYGMHHCLNIVTEKEEYPSAVLIRAVAALDVRHRVSNIIGGPGRLCQYFGVDKSFNNIDVFGDCIWVEDWGEKIILKKTERSKRIGVGYAGHCKDYPWRFAAGIYET